jgi:hypothetical protein
MIFFNAQLLKHQFPVLDEYLTNISRSISTVQVSFVQPEHGHAIYYSGELTSVDDVE